MTGPFPARLLQVGLPIITAIAVVAIVPVLTQISFVRDNAVLLAAGVALGFLIPSIREFLFQLVLFSVAFYAGRHAMEAFEYGQSSDWEIRPSEWVALIQWGLIALFAFIAGMGETRPSPSALGRSFYFLAIAVYFLGLAIAASIYREWPKMLGLGFLGALAVYGAIALPLVGPPRKQSAETPNGEPMVERKTRAKVRRL